MSNKTPDDILELARQRMALRREQVHQAEAEAQAERSAREQIWLRVFMLALGGLLLALLLVPGAPLSWKLYAIVHGLVAQEHNVFLQGQQLPICARNIGIYSSFLISAVYLCWGGRKRAGGLPSWPLLLTLIAFVLIMAVDGINSVLGTLGQTQWYASRNDLRTITGVGFGIAMTAAILLVFNRALRRDVEKQQPVMGWRDLGILLVLNGLMVLGVYSNSGLLYWPLAFLSFFGLVGELFVINLLVISMLMGYGRSITRLDQLARPATIALFTNLTIIGALAMLRFAEEAQAVLR